MNNMYKTLSKIFNKIKSPLANKDDTNNFLDKCKGVIHIGANTGQERDIYFAHKLPVVWVEPIPEIFLQLQKNIESYPGQKAYNFLLSDKDEMNVTLHISSNDGLSSSVLNLKGHKEMWSDIDFVRSIELKSKTLPALIQENNIDVSNYDAMVLDTQGSELSILKGSIPVLNNFRFIKTEVSDFESYENACTLSQLTEWMNTQGFIIDSKYVFASKKNVGNYYDVLYRRK